MIMGFRAHFNRPQLSCTPSRILFSDRRLCFLNAGLWLIVTKLVYVCRTWKEIPHWASSTALRRWHCCRRTLRWWDIGVTTWPRTVVLHRVSVPYNCRSLGADRRLRFLRRKPRTGISSRASLPSVPGTRRRLRLLLQSQPAKGVMGQQKLRSLYCTRLTRRGLTLTA